MKEIIDLLNTARESCPTMLKGIERLDDGPWRVVLRHYFETKVSP